MRGRRKAGVILCGILCLVMLLSVGCGKTEVPEDLSVSALSVTSKGQVTTWLAEDFDKDYYDLQELRSMVDEEVAEFNKNHQSQDEKAAVTVQSLEMMPGNQKVMLVLQFRDIASYKEYTGADLFYGTVTQAKEAGYDLDIQLISTKDGSTIGQAEIDDQSKKHILIAQEKVRIYGPAKPLYLSPGAAANEDGSVDVSEGAEDNIYIIMK